MDNQARIIELEEENAKLKKELLDISFRPSVLKKSSEFTQAARL